MMFGWLRKRRARLDQAYGDGYERGWLDACDRPGRTVVQQERALEAAFGQGWRSGRASARDEMEARRRIRDERYTPNRPAAAEAAPLENAALPRLREAAAEHAAAPAVMSRRRPGMVGTRGPLVAPVHLMERPRIYDALIASWPVALRPRLIPADAESAVATAARSARPAGKGRPTPRQRDQVRARRRVPAGGAA